MIPLFERRSDILLGFRTEDALISTQKLLYVLLGGHAHRPIIITDEIASKMEVDWARTLKFKLIFVLQKIGDSLGVLGCSRNIIYVDAYVLINLAILLHPDVWLSLTGDESHVSKTVGKAFMPAKSRGPETVKCIEDDEGVSLQLTKFRAGNDIDLFLSFCLKVSIANVSGPKIEIIELGQEDKESDTME